MKIGFSPNYYVQVFPDGWEEDPQRAAFYDGIITVTLNMVLPVRFIPDVSEAGPPWQFDLLADDVVELTTPRQVREYGVITSAFSVTPNGAMAGQVEHISTPTGDSIVFYVTPDEFATYEAELMELTDIASDSVPSVRRDEVLDRDVIRFIDERVLEEPQLKVRRGDAVGRAPDTGTPSS